MSSEPKSVNRKPLLLQLAPFWCTPEYDCWVHTGQNYSPGVRLDRTKLCRYKNTLNLWAFICVWENSGLILYRILSCLMIFWFRNNCGLIESQSRSPDRETNLLSWPLTESLNCIICKKSGDKIPKRRLFSSLRLRFEILSWISWKLRGDWIKLMSVQTVSIQTLLRTTSDWKQFFLVMH